MQEPSHAPRPEPLDEASTPLKEAVAAPNPGGHVGWNHRLLWMWLVAAAVVAGSLSWYCGEKTLDYYQPSEAASKNLFNPGPLRKELAVIVPRNVAIAYGTLGGLLGLLLGLAGGLTRRSATGGIAAAVVGGLVGGLAGAGISFVLVPVFQATFDPMQPSMMHMVAIRGGIWAAIGAAAGLAFGLGLAHRPNIFRALLGGLVGSLAGTVLFEVSNAVMDPLDRNDQTIPTTLTARLLSYLSIALCVAIGTALAVRVARPTANVGERPA